MRVAQKVLAMMMMVTVRIKKGDELQTESKRVNSKSVYSLGPRMEIRVPNRTSSFLTSEIRRRVPKPK